MTVKKYMLAGSTIGIAQQQQHGIQVIMNDLPTKKFVTKGYNTRRAWKRPLQRAE